MELLLQAAIRLRQGRERHFSKNPVHGGIVGAYFVHDFDPGILRAILTNCLMTAVRSPPRIGPL
jgi:hypothetical protein